MQLANPPSAPDQPRLSKSKIAAFEQCPRRLWLQVHRHELAQFDEATLERFQCGHFVGELARRGYRHGVLVAQDHTQIPEALARTTELLNADVQQPIFEAAFERDNVLIRADILEPDHWGGWRLIEVKNSRSVGSHIIRDIATQTWVLQGNDVCVSAAIARHVERPLQPSSRNPTVRFVDQDVTSQARRVALHRPSVIDQARKAVEGPEPLVRPGSHCQRPSCEFRAHCGEQSPAPTFVGQIK